MRRHSFFALAAACCLAFYACDDGDSGNETPPDNSGPTDQNSNKDECTNGQTKCDGYSLLVCNNGKFASQPCGSNQICAEIEEKSRCMTQEEYDELTKPKVCTEDQTTCQGNTLMGCYKGQWGLPVDCTLYDQICVTRGNKSQCETPDCTPGTSKCISDTIHVCSDKGEFEEGQDCSAGTPPMSCEMQGNTASCVETCTEGSKRCTTQGKLETCTNGSFVASDCPAGHECTIKEGTAACIKPPECTNGETQCKGEILRFCAEETWQDITCPGDRVCKTDTESGISKCEDIPCTEGETRCGAGNVLSICYSGVWSQVKCLLMDPIRYCDANGNPDSSTGLDKAACVLPNTSSNIIDTDNDTIPDDVEGRAQNRDTDNDTVPDYLDLDSDGDNIPDSIEARNFNNPNIPPEDADGDGAPNYVDLDSDNNGIPDIDEACPAGKDCQIVETHKWVTENGTPLQTTFNAIMAPYNTNSDADDIPDFVDSDNDGDLFPDTDEIVGIISDTRFPGTGNFSGSCNEKNLAMDIFAKQGSTDNPIDCDNDTIPDYMDNDSDNDGVLDFIESHYIRNGFYARYTSDLDMDGISDYDECYPLNNGLCRDSDGDGIPDLAEIDSDNDGVLDAIEAKLGSDPTVGDTDNDNAPDLLEYALCVEDANGAEVESCPAITDAGKNPQADGNFVFTTPYLKPSDPPQTMSLETAIQTVDIFFSFDQSSSMRDEVYSLKTNINMMLSELQCADLGLACKENRDCKNLENAICSEKGRCITNPNTGCLNDMWTGLGFYHRSNSFWVTSHLSEGAAQTLTMLTGMFSNPDDMMTFRASGNSEAPYNAAICAVYGPETDTSLCWQRKGYYRDCASNVTNSTTDALSECKMNCTNDSSKIGCVGYRPSAIRLYIQAFDEYECFEGPNKDTEANCNSYKANAGDVLKSQNVRWLGLWSDNEVCRDISDKIGTDSDSLDETNTPYTYEVTTDNLYYIQAKEGILNIAQTMPLDITSDVQDLDSTDNLNASKLISSVTVHTAADLEIQGRFCSEVTENVTSTVSNGITLEGIEATRPGRTLCFDVVPVNNQSVFPATTKVQIKKARVKVLGDGSVLNSGIAYFVIPPVLEETNI